MCKKLIITLLSLGSLVAGAQNSYDPLKVLGFCKDQDYDQALLYLNAVPAPENEQYLFDLGYVHYLSDHAPEAKAAFLKLYEKNPNLQSPQLYLARLYDQAGAEQTALLHYKNLVALDPGNYKYWHFASGEWLKLKQPDSALAYIRKSYTLKPTAGRVVYELCTLLDNVKQKQEAEQVADRFLQSDTSYFPVMGKKVELCFDAGRYHEAITWGERLRIRNVAPISLSNAYIHLLYSYLNVKQPDSALSVYNWLQLQHANNESATYGAALAHAMKKNYTISDSLLTECIAFNIQEMAATYLTAKAANAIAVKDYNRAIALYDTSYYIFKNPLDLFQAGRIFDHYLKSRERATGYYKRYLRQQPQPTTNEEENISRYIREFLNPQKK
ncbi:hypothetical protein LL912_13050 [Niabella sp. CC-SYL272]|uniref:tetratricopeptide repeat protein n=1 Tax=Niabella agricola TaxID=2891571 RepID=UPI001F43DF9C|nr:hypothetical protein [Niabella agricola]MCF3109701.1 hypothetical protein [Niabella agricola]